jgi:hypothetical protein
MKSGNSLGFKYRGISAGAPVFAKSTAMEWRVANCRHFSLRAVSGSQSACTKWAVEMAPKVSLII